MTKGNYMPKLLKRGGLSRSGPDPMAV